MKTIKYEKKRNKIDVRIDILRYALLIICAIPMILPLIWMISVALQSGESIFTTTPQWIPKEFNWSNFSEAFERIDFFSKFINTLIITVVSTIGQVLSCTLVAYSLSRINFKGRKVWFLLIIASMMLPPFVSIIPVFKLFSSIGWYDTWWPLIVPAFLGGSFNIFLLRQYMMGIPKSYDEAARIDGANHLQILFKIILPMCKPAVICIIIMAVQGAWNDYLAPLIYLKSQDKWTLSLAMAQFSGEYATSWNLFMAADLIYMLPMVILFLSLQKYFMDGLGSLNSVGK